MAEELVSASCGLSVDSNYLEMSSRFVYEVTEGFVGQTCHPWMVSCTVGVLPEGHYQVRHGIREAELVIPAEGNLDCDSVLEMEGRIPDSAKF
jgi:hypothetical protein